MCTEVKKSRKVCKAKAVGNALATDTQSYFENFLQVISGISMEKWRKLMSDAKLIFQNLVVILKNLAHQLLNLIKLMMHEVIVPQ